VGASLVDWTAPAVMMLATMLMIVLMIVLMMAMAMLVVALENTRSSLVGAMLLG
jgi:hypothetical protein